MKRISVVLIFLVLALLACSINVDLGIAPVPHANGGAYAVSESQRITIEIVGATALSVSVFLVWLYLTVIKKKDTWTKWSIGWLVTEATLIIMALAFSVLAIQSGITVEGDFWSGMGFFSAGPAAVFLIFRDKFPNLL